MSVTAAIKFTQGVSTAPAGEALIGVASTAVTVDNGNDFNVVEWQWQLLGKPNGSALPLGIFAFGAIPSASFTPDVSGWYLVGLTVFDSSGRSATDERVFAIPETSGRHIPCAGADRKSANFGGSTLGWDPYLQAWLKYLDTVSGGGGYAPLPIEIDFDQIQTTFTTATVGKVRDITMARYAAPMGYTRSLLFEGSLVSSVHGTTTQARLYDVTAGVYITGSTVDNSAAPNQASPTSFSVPITAGTINGTVRTDVIHQYELHVFRVGGAPTDLCKASGRVVLSYV